MSKPAFGIKTLQRANKPITKSRAMKKPGGRRESVKSYMLPKRKKHNMLPRVKPQRMDK